MKRILSLIALMVWTACLFAQDVQVKGKIVSKTDGQPIPGVSVSVKGTTTGTITNIDGEYTLSAPQGATLVYSFIGMKTQEVVATSGTMDVAMADDVADLNEVVVVGYGVQKKSLVTGAIAKVNGAELTKVSDGRVTQALQGKTAGVVITSNSGQPGDNVSIRVRGTGTNSDNEPLYIIDGLPMSSGGTDFLSPADIESIEVLKDGASCAIYGARGANGVVIITTKAGKNNTKSVVTYDGYYGVQNAARKISLLNSEQYLMLSNEANYNGGTIGSVFTPAQMEQYSKVDTDWQDEMLNGNAPKQSHTVSMSGGSDKISFASSLSYFDQEGIVAKGKSDYSRIGYRLNTDADFGFLKLSGNINLVHIENHGIDVNSTFGNGLIQATNMPPIVPVYEPGNVNHDGWGTPEFYPMGIGPSIAIQEVTNPVAQLSYLNNQTKTNKAIYGLAGSFDFGKLYEPLKGLSYRVSYGGEYAIVNTDTYNPQYDLDSKHNRAKASVSKDIRIYDRWNFENVFTYDKTIDIHHITLMGGVSAFKENYENLNGSRTKPRFKDLEHALLDNCEPAATTDDIGNGGTRTEHTIASSFGRLNYDLMNRYMFSATVRRDGSSRFGSENKYGIFPSVSAGWVLSEESFMAPVTEYVNFMKLRASWGQNGNESFGDNSDFRYSSVIEFNDYYYFGSDKSVVVGARPKSVANPTLRWETSEQTNIGLDLGLLDNELRFTLDYYIKSTKDWLLEPPVMATVGNPAPAANGGEVKNSGFEAEITYRHQFGKFVFEGSVNGAANKNEVVSIENSEQRLQGGEGARTQGDVLYAFGPKSTIGATSMGVFYGLTTDGIFQSQAEIDAYTRNGSKIQPMAKPGDVRFVDRNQDGKIDDNDKSVIGTPHPKFTGGLNLKVEAYGFDLSTSLYASLGQDVYDATSRATEFVGTNLSSEWLNRWTGPGTSNTLPRLTSVDDNGNDRASDLYVKDGSFLRMRTLTLGYSLPKSILTNVKLNRVRFYVSGENLVTFTKYKGYDPEIGGGPFSNGIDRGIYPQARTVLGGVNVTF